MIQVQKGSLGYQYLGFCGWHNKTDESARRQHDDVCDFFFEFPESILPRTVPKENL